MLTRLRRSIQLAKLSWDTLKQDRELLALPILGFVIGGAISAPFFIGAAIFDDNTGLILGVAGAGIFLYIITYCQAALICGTATRLDGGNPTIGSAFKDASQHKLRIAGWVLILLGVRAAFALLNRLSSRFGRYLESLANSIWNTATFLTLPAIVLDRKGPISGLTHSVKLLKTTWGENITAQIGFGIIGAILITPILLIPIIYALLGNVDNALLLLLPIPILLYILAVSLTLSALSVVYRTALYYYATNRHINQTYMNTDTLHKVLTSRKPSP